MMDDFAPDDALGGLDLSSLLNAPQLPQAATPPFVAPQQRQGGGMGMKGFGPLAALIPIALARGGQGAVAALMAGFQQRQMHGQQQDRLARNDQRADQQASDAQQYRNAQLENQRKAQQLAFLKQVQAGIADIDDPDMLARQRAAYTQVAQQFGIDPAAINALTDVPVTRMQRKAAEKVIAGIQKQFGDKWMERGRDFTWTVPGEGVRLSLDALLSRVGQERDPNAPAQAPTSTIAPDVPLDRQHAMAIASGNEPLAKQIEEAMRRQDSAKSQPVDPQLADINRQIAQMRLEGLRANKDTTGLPPRLQRSVDAQARGFDAQPITKRTQTIAEAVTFAESMNPNTKNPQDDQALIYAYAKAQDPDSVVREGEYATVQRYAQSWAEQFGFDVARIFSNTTFLTPQARANMKANIRLKYQAARVQYDNVRSEYARRINRITNANDGEEYLIDYAGGFPTMPGQTAPAERVGGGGLTKPSAGNPYGGGRAR